MRKALNTKTSAKKNRKAAKIADLPAQQKRAAAVKGGVIQGNFIGTDRIGSS